jgi:hypothetical protein
MGDTAEELLSRAEESCPDGEIASALSELDAESLTAEQRFRLIGCWARVAS